MQQKILGLDLGSNSIGWALMSEKDNEVNGIVDLGSRIFNKAVEEKVPTPKNQKRRDMRLGRRVLQRRARRKQKMINYLISLDLLPQELNNNFGKEKLLNGLGDPYELRTKGLDTKLKPHELGRVLLHFVARRGFLSSKKQIAGDLIDDPDTQVCLLAIQKDEDKKRKTKEAKAIAQGKIIKPKADDQSEGAFKADIYNTYQKIKKANCRTLGEYLFNLDIGKVKRNRSHDGGHLRTDRAMYKNELDLIWQAQKPYFTLPDKFIDEIHKIVFYQRPLKLKKDRVGKCSQEPKHYRTNWARLEAQRFRYLQDINNLQYFERETEQWSGLSDEQKEKLKTYFEHNPKITITQLKKELGLDKFHKINLETKNLKGNITACEIRNVIGDIWDKYSNEKQSQLFEDLFTIKKKSSLKARLITHWDFNKQTAVKLCLIEFEPSHSSYSLKAIKHLLPFLEQGLTYDKARVACGYDYKAKKTKFLDKLPSPPETSNPIVNKGLHELRRVVNAIIKEHGKPGAVRIEMARDLEMNTRRYKENKARQRKNQKANEEATQAYQEQRKVTDAKYPSYDEKIRYRLWLDQDKRCAYSGKTIALGQVFSSECEIDHILPFKKSLDDSYMNKALCFKIENSNKEDRTPIDAWGSDNDKWNQITQAISRWDKSLKSKVDRFHKKEAETNWRDKDFIGSQLTDTRYISRLAQNYMLELGAKVDVTKGFVVSKIRHQWGFNNLIGETDKKERTDHRHHAIDAVVIAATSRGLYQQAVRQIKQDKLKIPKPYTDISQELDEKLKHLIISHTPQRKLSGALHKETGASYIALKDKSTGKIIKEGLVCRKTLNTDFTIKNAMSIVDEQVKTKVLEHIENFGNVKEAFNTKNLQDLKLGKNPIKRVRIFQSHIKTTKNKTAKHILGKTKFGVKDKSGKVFKHMSYGNIHHVEIIKNIKTGKFKGEFVTMMEASHRAKGINTPKQTIIKTDHGNKWEFLIALHKNDTISLEKENGGRVFYRVQKLNARGGGLTLRLNTASTLKNKNEELGASISGLFDKNIRMHKINAIGGLIGD